MILLSVLAGIAPCTNAAYGQRRVLASPQQWQSRSLHVQLAGEQPRPLAMVSGDFDEDGVKDLAIGYGLAKGGSILLLKGNLDAHAPQTRESWVAAGRHQYSEPYLQSSKPVSVAQQPGVMIAADVNGDGHLDVVYATQGSSQLNVLFGDGKGNFLAPIHTSVAGGITALASYRPGSPLSGEAIVAGYQSNNGARLSVLTWSTTALAVRTTFPLPGPATAMTVANLDADLIPDTAIVAGGNLLILHGNTALSGRGSLTTVPVSGAESVAAGEFLFDRHAQMQLSVLTASGNVVILAHSGFDPRPYTPQQIAETRRRGNTLSLAQQAGNNGNEPWVEVETNAGAGGDVSGGKAPILLRSRISGSGGDDLVVINSSQQQRTVIRHAAASSQNASVAAPSQVTSGSIASDNVVSAVSAQVTPAASQGLVLLSADNISPEFTVPSTGNTFYVNTTADNTGTTTDSDDGTRCTSGAGEVCTLRDAVTFANNDASDNISVGTSDTIMVPAGTYSLTWQAGTVDGNTNAVTHLEILGPVTIIGSTTDGGTILNGANNDTVFTINPGPFGSENPSGNSYIFDTTLENLVIEGGKNPNNLNNNGFANYVGGGMNWDAFSTGNLTLTNTTVENNTALWGPGGGIWAQNSAGGGTGTLTISGGSIAANSTPELGGGLLEAFPPSALSVSNTTITGNIANISVNPSDGDADGAGGGMYLEGRQPPPATPQSTLTGVTITSNNAANDNGGGIATFTGILLSGSTISNNSAGGSGGGLWSNAAGDGSQTTVTGTNFLSNTATETGGAIALGLETQAEGNILQVSLSRIVGNTAAGGGSGLANGVAGDGAGEAIATENWWGCNSGPTTASDGCDQAALENSGGSLTTAPYAQLGFSSDITTIPPGGSMNLTVSLNTDSNGNAISGAFPAVATNYPYTFGVTGVSADPPLTTGIFNTSGVGTAVLTPSTSGNGTVTVSFDNQTDAINFNAQATTATSLSIVAIPGTTFLYGQPSGFTVQLTPGNATGITTANFQVTVDGSSTLGASSFGLVLIGNNDYQIFGPFNLLAPGGHTLAVKFLGTTDFATSNTSTPLSVSAGTVSIGTTVTPTNPALGQGGSVAVTVSGVGSGAQPSSSLTYAFDGGSSNSATLSGGTATITIPATLSAGSNSLTISYSGDGNYAPASTSVPFTVFAPSQTRIASLTATTATIDVFGFGFMAPSGQLSFTDATSVSPVAAPVTLNTVTATPSLLPQVTTSTGVNSLPVWTELGDVNGDGIPDLITSVFGTDSVNVQSGNGNGTFGAATSILIAPGFGPAEVHAVSLRGNGTLDLIVGSFNTNQIAVLLGIGNGTFEPPVFYTVGTAINTPTSLTAGDFNDDGNLDVAVANTGNNTVSILLGNGSGSLTPLGAPIAVGRYPEAIRAGDFNGDGYSDLAVANYVDGTVTILLNNRNDTFSASSIPVGTGPQALAITGSGTNLLLAVANYVGNTVSVLQSNNDGTFAAAKVVSVGHGPDDVRFADFNGDGIPDMAVANYTDGTVSLVLGNSGGSYTTPAPFPVGDNPYSAAVGDLDRDGTPDIVVANCFSNNIGVLLSGTQISVPYSGLELVPGDTLQTTYTPDGSSKYGSSTSPGVTAP
jgi:CSLREA domain-containing protein